MFNQPQTFGNLADTSFEQPVNTELLNDVLKYQNRVKDILIDEDSISVKELKRCENLGPYRDWFCKLIKQVNKFQQTVDQDFIQQFNLLASSQTQLHEVMMQNEAMQRKIIKLEAKVRKKHGDNNESANS